MNGKQYALAPIYLGRMARLTDPINLQHMPVSKLNQNDDARIVLMLKHAAKLTGLTFFRDHIKVTDLKAKKGCVSPVFAIHASIKSESKRFCFDAGMFTEL